MLTVDELNAQPLKNAEQVRNVLRQIARDIMYARELGWMYTAHSGVVHPVVVEKLRSAGYKVLRVKHRSEMPLYYISWNKPVLSPPSDSFYMQCIKLHRAAVALAK